MKTKLFFALLLAIPFLLTSCYKDGEFKPKDGLLIEDVISFYNMDETVLDNKMSHYDKLILEDGEFCYTEKNSTSLKVESYDALLTLEAEENAIDEVLVSSLKNHLTFYDIVKSKLEKLYGETQEEVDWNDGYHTKSVAIIEGNKKIQLVYSDLIVIGSLTVLRIEDADEESTFDIDEIAEKCKKLNENYDGHK